MLEGVESRRLIQLEMMLGLVSWPGLPIDILRSPLCKLLFRDLQLGLGRFPFSMSSVFGAGQLVQCRREDQHAEGYSEHRPRKIGGRSSWVHIENSFIGATASGNRGLPHPLMPFLGRWTDYHKRLREYIATSSKCDRRNLLVQRRRRAAMAHPPPAPCGLPASEALFGRDDCLSCSGHPAWTASGYSQGTVHILSKLRTRSNKSCPFDMRK